jgi:hypothetical protein
MNCGALLEDNDRFCPGCGAKAEAPYPVGQTLALPDQPTLRSVQPAPPPAVADPFLPTTPTNAAAFGGAAFDSATTGNVSTGNMSAASNIPVGDRVPPADSVPAGGKKSPTALIVSICAIVVVFVVGTAAFLLIADPFDWLAGPGQGTAVSEQRDRDADAAPDTSNVPNDQGTTGDRSTEGTNEKPTEKDNEKPADNEQPAKPATANDDYLIPDSDSRYLTDAEIRALSQEEMFIARNEIFARHGRGFKDEGLQKHFKSTGWYRERYGAEEFDKLLGDGTLKLNDYESKNAAAILAIEKELGYQ